MTHELQSLTNQPSVSRTSDRQIASSYRSAFASQLKKLGSFILRYGLFAILLYFGAYKFTIEEAQGIAPLLAHSPLQLAAGLIGTQAISNVDRLQ